MGKSFDKNLSTKLTIRDGQAVWANMLKRLVNSSTMRTDSNVEMRCYPYAKLAVGIDFAKDIDADPNHTSLPTGTYENRSYTHSDTCLCALYPDLAAALRPTVEYFIKTQWTVPTENNITLVTDAIGAMLAIGTEIYGTALLEAATVSGYKSVDENNFHLGTYLYGGVGTGQNTWMDYGKLNSFPTSQYTRVVATASYDAAAQRAATSTLEGLHSETQGAFDSKINAYLNRVFITPAMKTIVELFCSNIIKFRYADADTNRYAVFGPDAYVYANPTPSFTTAASFIQNLADNHFQVFQDRYVFLPDLMRSLGFIRLNGAKPNNPETKTDRIMINTANNSINIVYDESDVIKNMLDHNVITYDEIANTLKGTSVKAHDVYKGRIFTEADSYLNNELEIGDSILMDDGIISVLFHNGLRSYNSVFIDVYKANNSNIPVYTLSFCYPKPILKTSGTTLPDTTEAAIAALNELFNNTSLLDPTWVPVFTDDGNNPATFEQEFEHINTGINTYMAPVDDVQMIDSYAVTFICFDYKAIAKNNDELSKNKDQNNNAA